MVSIEAINKLEDYLQSHEELALRWQTVIQDPVYGRGYWEIIYVTGYIGFSGNALSSTSLDDLASRLPNR